MKKLRKGTKFLFFILVVLLVIVTYQFQQQVTIMKEPPSNKWGKEVYISEGKVTQNMQLIKYGENYVAVHNDDFNLKVLLFDSLGNVVKERLIKSEKLSKIYDFTLNLRDNMIFVSAVTEDEGSTCLKTSKLNSNLEIIKCDTVPLPGISGFYYIDENVFLTSSYPKRGTNEFGKINIHDWKKDKMESLKIHSIFENMMGIKTKDGYAIVYRDDENFYYCTYSNGKLSEPKPFLEYVKSGTFTYGNFVLASDNDNLYLMFDKERKGFYVGSAVTQANLKNGTVTNYELKNLKKENVKGYYSENGARYIYTSPYDNQVVDLIIKDGQTIEKNYISRLAPANTYSYVCDDMAIFAKFERPDFYKVYAASTEEEYKNQNNILRKVDFKMAVTKEMKGLTSVLTYLFTLGAMFILPMLAAVSIYSLINFRLVKKNKIRSYLIFSAIGVLFKTYMIFHFLYAANLIYYGIFTNSILVIVTSIIIGLSIYGYFFDKYRKDTVGIFMVRFLPPLLLDILITLILFVPFTV